MRVLREGVAVSGEVVVTGLPLGEGPGELPDGRWLVTGVTDGWIWRVDPVSGTAEPFADTAGSPNSLVVTTDGGAIVAQNGGVDMNAIPGLGPYPPLRPVPPSLQRVSPSGEVSTFATDVQSPNDLVVAADGSLWFTDPPHYPPQPGQEGTIRSVDANGRTSVWADGFTFCNGLARLSDGSWLTTEGPGLMRVFGPGRVDRTWVVETLPSPGDGLCVDEDDNAYLAGTLDGVVRIVSAAGEIVEELRPPVEGMITDCFFVGPERRTLVAFVAHPGVLVAWEGMPVPGQQQPLYEYTGP